MNYQNARIYSIRSYQTDSVYYGSTCQPLSKRLSCHKSDYKRWLEGKHNDVTSYEIVKYDDAYIELFENFPCESKEQLLKREGQIIRANNDAVNKIVAGRTYAEYYADNKDKLDDYQRLCYDANKEEIQAKQCVHCVCICGGKHSATNKTHHYKALKHINYMMQLNKII